VRHYDLAYIVSLCMLASLGLLLQEWALAQSRWDAHEVNLTGRQRLLSEKLVRLMMALTLLPDGRDEHDSAELISTLVQWLHVHQGLRDGDDQLRIPGARTARVRSLFAQIEPSRQDLSGAVTGLLTLVMHSAGHPGPVRKSALTAILRRAMASQKRYLTLMDRIVATLERDAVRRLNRAQSVDVGVLLAIIAVLALSGLLILRPTAKRIRNVMERIDLERRGLAGFVHDSPTPIIQLGSDGSFVTANQGAEEILAWLPGSPSDQGARVKILFQDCLKQSGPALQCNDLEVPVGDQYYLFHFIDVPGLDQIFALGIDITGRKKVEQAIAEARDAAEAANKLKSDFLATMSHELRTPLNAIIGFSEALASGTYGPLDARQIQKQKHILNAGRQLLELIDAVLDLSQIEAGRVTLEIDSVSVAPLLHSGLDLIRQTASDKGLEISLDIPPRGPRFEHRSGLAQAEADPFQPIVQRRQVHSLRRSNRVVGRIGRWRPGITHQRRRHRGGLCGRGGRENVRGLLPG
jgi:signal transduction histidine kinase